MDSMIISLIVGIVTLIFSVVIHEVAHGAVAYYFGDSTAKVNGRLTLNPLPHIDPMWTIIMPIIFFFSMGTPFGGAKPVPVNFFNLRNPKRDMIFISAAGPLANFLLALISLFTIAMLSRVGFESLHGVKSVMIALYRINLLLIAFNLIPIPPLDGSRILIGILPSGLAQAYSRLEPYGFIIIVALLFTGLLHYLYVPLLSMVNVLLHMICY